LITVDGAGENMISVASGANHVLTADDVDQIPEANWRAARVLLGCLESPLPTVARALARAKELGLTTILNPAPATEIAAQPDLLQLVDVLTPNELEAATLLGATYEPPDPTESARQLRQRGARHVIVTCGAQGCVVVAEEDAPVHVPSHRVTAV